MILKEQLISVIYQAIDEVNAVLPPDQQLEKSIHTVLFGESGKLDSLGLVNMIVTTEQKIEENFGIAITLADEKAMSQRNSPFRTVESLAEYIPQLITERQHA
ncbi:MAG: hypothetical protein HUU32_15915 [Calditrichaceae bacterium]|nr:hypothetical protein [Calditrichia bacterium]NUQ42874.1 hypothetical protein [Calditrichaceae bacterium]